MWKRMAAGAVLVFAVMTNVCALSAQDALVLSGGGARGLAHVGALEHLRDLGYDPEIVVGNSMGAVVGALFSAGYEPEEMQRRIISVHWNEMFLPTPVVIGPNRSLRFPTYNIDLDVSNRRLSRGIFGQWRVNRELERLLFDANVRSRGDFNRLPRRFRAVATDLKTGRRIVLDTGDVARAVRASMAYPGFFAPVTWGDRILTDGGISDNFPTSVARQMGATRVVGVDVTKPTKEIKSTGPLSVLARSFNIMQQNMQRDTIPLDGFVAPHDNDLSIGPSFPENPLPLIASGKRAAARDIPALAPSTRHPTWALADPPKSFTSIRFESPDSSLLALGVDAFASIIGRPYDPAAIASAADRLFATGLYEGVWTRIAPNGDSALLVRLDAPPPLSIAVAAFYENDRGGLAWAALDRYTRLGLRPLILSLTASVGALERFASLESKLWAPAIPTFAFSNGVYVQERSERFFDDNTRTTLDVTRGGAWIAAELPHLLNNRLISLGGRTEWINVEDGAQGWSYGPLLRFASTAKLTRVVGAPLLLELEHRWGEIPYSRAAGTASITIGNSRGPQFAPIADVRIVSNRAPIDVIPALGDEHAVPGLRWGEARGRARAVVGGDVAFPLIGGFVIARARTGTVAHDVADWSSSRWTSGVSLGACWPTPLGSISAAYGVATQGGGRFDVSIGRPF